MNTTLISKLETVQEYLKIDRHALIQEIENTTRAINELKAYYKNLKTIKRLTNEIKETKLDPEYQEQLISIMTKYPMLRSIREAEVMYQALQAIPNKEIANNLCISDKTVRFHKTNIFKRCGFKNTIDMIKKNYHIVASELPSGVVK